MNYSTWTVAQLEERRAAIATECEADGADLDALEAEVREINAELETRKAAAEKRAAIRGSVAQGAGRTVEKIAEDKKADKTVDEIRGSKAYINAFAEYLKTGNDKECRALLTNNVTGGTVPVPVIVDEIIHTAWENDQILQRVRKTNFRGNLKVPFEISASGAIVHTEGGDPITEETLALGIVTMIPAMIKKFIRVSDEVVAMGGEPFVRYIYDELVYQIIRKLAQLVVADIATAPAASSATAVGVAQVTAAPSITAIPEAFANLSDQAVNNVVIINRLTYAAFIAAYAAGNFAVDPFMGLPVLYSSALPAYSAATAGAVYAIVGDLDGVQVNYPEGEDVVIKYDDLSESEEDLVKITGRQYAAHGVVTPGKFVNLKKPA